MDRVVSPFLPEAIPKVVASGWMHSVCNVETLGHYCTPLRGKEQREWLKGCMAGCWLFLQAQVTCTYWGLGGDLGVRTLTAEVPELVVGGQLGLGLGVSRLGLEETN